MADTICMPSVGLVAVLNAAICVAMSSRLVERTPLMLAASHCLYVVSCGLTRLILSMLFPLIVSLPVLFCFQGGAVLFKMPNTLTIVAPHLIAVVPGMPA